MINIPGLLAGLGIQSIRKGPRLYARCPSPEHVDKHPSWYIWADERDRHGLHRCYSCGFRGGPQALVQAVLGCDAQAARAWLKSGNLRYAHLDAVVEVQELLRRTEVLPPQWVQFADDYAQWPSLAVRYLRKRQVTCETVNRWGLGWAAKGELGGRIWLPIRDPGGRLCCWQARTYVDDTLRYLTQNRVPAKTLFGAYHWPEVEDRRVLVVVEGPFDALAVDQATRIPVGALIGSEPTPLQMSALTTFETLVVMTDADAAGDKAAAALQGLGRWVNVVRVRLPDGMDPGAAPAQLLCDTLAPWKSSWRI